MKKTFMKTLLSLTLIMSLLVSGVAYQADTASAEDENTIFLNVGYTTPANAVANTPVEHSFSLEAGEDAYISLDVPAVVNANIKITSVATGNVIYNKDVPNVWATDEHSDGWLYDTETQTYYWDISWQNPTAGEYKVTLTFGADTAYAIAGMQKKSAAPVQNPYLNYSKVTVTKGFSQKLAVNDNTGTVTWKSSNAKVASVDKNGKVTGKKEGKATITASLADGKSLKCAVTVKANAYTAPKMTAKSVPYGKTAMNVYKVSYSSKKDLVIKARFLNNSSHKAKSLKNVKITIRNEKNKVIGVYSASKVTANVKHGKVKDYTFTIKKAKLKIKSTQDLRKIKYPTATGTFVYSL